jgi:hypothetical protein
MRVFIANSCATSRRRIYLGQTHGNDAFLKHGELQMLLRLKRTSFCSLAFLFITAGAFGAPSFAAPTVGQDNSNQSKTKSRRQLHNTSPRRQVGSIIGSKHRQRTIIFVGGKLARQGAATKSNPTRARKSNGALNPQPIPPGKQRKPE